MIEHRPVHWALYASFYNGHCMKLKKTKQNKWCFVVMVLLTISTMY